METPRGSAADWLANLALRGVIGAARTMPYEARLSFMSATMRRAIGPLAGFRRRAESNLALIWPERTPEDRRAIADGVLDNFGRTVIENYSHPEFNARVAPTQPEGAGVDAVMAARADGRPVMFVTGHFGNHEAPRHVLHRLGCTIGGLYRPFANPYFDAHYRRSLQILGGPVFPQGRRGTMGLLKYLRDGGMALLFFDVNSDAGEPVPFLGRPAMTALSAAEIALKTNAALVPYFGIRQADGFSFQTVIEAPVPPSDPLTMTTELNARLGAHVHAHPEQWFWVHRRWKDKAGRIAALDKNRSQASSGTKYPGV